MDTAITASRDIRVFLSSTFADMQGERDYLVKKIFPAIKRECLRRNVEFTVLDLRWGITEEEAKSGRVMEICMDEISRTRPFFIGLIGGRYGWIPENDGRAVNERLLQRYPHIRAGISAGKSITEMEMQYGVLDYPEKTYSHFFIRSLRTVPKRFRDKRGSAAAEKRERLKDTVRNAAAEGRCSVSDYSSLKELGRKVTEALMATVDALYPVDEKLSHMDFVMSAHDNAVDRLRRVYVPRESDIDYDRMADMNSLLTLDFESGWGKSAWIANTWPDKRIKLSGGKELPVIHTMIGGEIDSAEMCRRALAYELGRRFAGIKVPDLNLPRDKKVDLRSVIKQLPPDKNDFIWILDGVDKITVDADRQLIWCKELFPSAIPHLMVTGSDREQLRHINTELINDNIDVQDIFLHPLGESQKMALTAAYLRNFAKGLTASQRASIANDPEMSSPGALRIFLNELLQYGVYENLDGFMAGYLDAPDMPSFIDKVLSRIDSDFDSRLVAKLFNMLMLSRYGLYEDDIMSSLGLKPVEWAAIYDAVSDFIELKQGRISIIAGMKADVIASHYPLVDKEIRQLRNTILRLSQARYKIDMKGAVKSMDWSDRLIYGMTYVLLRSRKIDIKDTSLMQRISMELAEIFIQLIGLKRYNKALSCLKHFRMICFQEYQVDVIKEMRSLNEANISLSGLFDTFDVICSSWIDKSILGFHRQIIEVYGQPGDFQRCRRKIKCAPLARKTRQRLLDFWDNKNEERKFIDLWDEKGDVIDYIYDMVMNINDLFTSTTGMSDINAKILRTLDRELQKEDADEEINIHMYLIAAISAARMDNGGDVAAKYLDLINKNNTSRLPVIAFANIYADCLIDDRRSRFDDDFDDFSDLLSDSVATSMGIKLLQKWAEALKAGLDKDNDAVRKLVVECIDGERAGVIPQNTAYNIGFILYNVKFYDCALVAFETYFEAGAEVPVHKLTHSYWGAEAAFKGERYDRAASLYETSLELLRANKDITSWSEGSLLRDLSLACMKCGRHDDAIRYAAERIGLHDVKNTPASTMSQLYNTLGVRYSAKVWTVEGDERTDIRNEVLSCFQKASEYAPDDRIIRLNIASIRNNLYIDGHLTDDEMRRSIAEVEKIYNVAGADGDDEAYKAAAPILATAYNAFGEWNKLVTLLDANSSLNLLNEKERHRAYILCRIPEKRSYVVEKYINVLIAYGINRYIDEIIERISDFDIVDDVINSVPWRFESFAYYENCISALHYIGRHLDYTPALERSHALLVVYMKVRDSITERFENIALNYCKAEGRQYDDGDIKNGIERLRRIYINEVGSAEELELKELRYTSLSGLRDKKKMSEFIDTVSSSPYCDNVIETILSRVYEDKDEWSHVTEFIVPLIPLLKEGTASESTRELVKYLLDEVSQDEKCKNMSSELVDIYRDLGMSLNSTLVINHLYAVEDAEGIEAAIKLYEERYIDSVNGLDLYYAVALRKIGQNDRAMKVVDLYTDISDDNQPFWIDEKIRLCRNTGLFNDALTYYRRLVKIEGALERTGINLWMVASVLTYAGCHEEALAVLEKEMGQYDYYDATEDDNDSFDDFEKLLEDFENDSDTNPLRDIFPAKDELNFFFSILLKSVIYFRMGNERLGYEIFKKWEEKAARFESSGHEEVPLLALREIELARLEKRKGNQDAATRHVEHARILISHNTQLSFPSAVLDEYLRE